MGKKGQIPWNKGKKLHYQVWNAGKKGTYSLRHPGQFKKGIYRGYGFKKSHIPWNKGTKGLMPIPWNKGTHIQTNNALKKWIKKYGSWAKGKKLPQITGEKHFNWKGGKFKQDGYVLVYKPKHPYTNKSYVFEHRLVMEKILGRYLTKEERVHHINGVKDDNRPKNLIYFANESDHQKYHQKVLHNKLFYNS